MFFILSAVDCGALLDPDNGQVNHTYGTTFGKTATYSCNSGYILVGVTTRTCQETKSWSESEPTCQRMLYYLTCTQWASKFCTFSVK